MNTIVRVGLAPLLLVCGVYENHIAILNTCWFLIHRIRRKKTQAKIKARESEPGK